MLRISNDKRVVKQFSPEGKAATFSPEICPRSLVFLEVAGCGFATQGQFLQLGWSAALNNSLDFISLTRVS